jgi:hypothetical protein
MRASWPAVLKRQPKLPEQDRALLRFPAEKLGEALEGDAESNEVHNCWPRKIT